MIARGWAFGKGARKACYFIVETATIPASSLCGRTIAYDAARRVNDKYAGDDRCPACQKILETREEIRQ